MLPVTRRHLIAAALFAGAGRRPDPPQTGETLRVVWGDTLGALHPYFATTHAAYVVAHHVWDTLLLRDPETLQLRPALARSWRATADAITVTLRPDVAFHDGTVLTAGHVARTVRLATTDPRVTNPDDYAFIAGSEVLDPLTVRIRLAYPFAPALDFLASVLPILALRDATGGSAPPAGTGPYALASAGPSRITLSRFGGYVRDGPKAGATLDAIALATMDEAADRMAAIAAGDADWTWDIGATLFDDATRTPALTTLRQETMRVAYLAFDAQGRGGPSPWTDAGVRRAVALGLDRAGIARVAAPLGARALDVPCFPTQFGCDTEAVGRVTPDARAARAALAAAAYPDGFETALVTSLPARAVRPVIDGLRALGIETRVEILAPDAARARHAAGEAPVWLGLTDGFGINDVSATFPALLGGGPFDATGDDAVRTLIRNAERGGADRRRGAYTEALRRTGESAAVLPLYAFVRTYAFARTLQFRAQADDVPRFYQTGWK